ncbi:MAG: PadR family transcriptional regulator [Devosia sp.]|nr:PadR family transcriptional regulator [Devosia sp.]
MRYSNPNDPNFPFGPGQWRRFEDMARNLGRWPGMGALRDGNFFDHKFKISRMLASGDVRLVALYFIEQQPRHGYDLIKAIEDRSHGFYSPSPGIMYPALTFLEEAGYVTSSSDGNKKLYTITDEGRAHLADNRGDIDTTLTFLGRAGEKMGQWRDKMSAMFTGEAGADAPEPNFAGEPGRGFGGPGRGPGRHRDSEHQARPDRDIQNVVPEVNEARRELKAAIAEIIALGEDTQRQAAGILKQAAADIRKAATPADDGDIDL